MVTLKDIAKRACVNVSTVSRALNDSEEIGKETKDAIRHIAEQLNYKPNLTARALVGKGTNSVGIILPEVRSNYYAQIANYIESELKTYGYSMLIGLSEFETNEEAHYLDVLASHMVDGILMVSVMKPSIREKLKKASESFRIPIVMMDCYQKIQGFDRFSIDENYSLLVSIEHFKNSGLKRIGFISDEIAASARYKCFLCAMKKCDLDVDPDLVRIGKERFERGGYLRMKEILASGKKADGVFAAYDNMAIGAMKAATDSGLRIPDEISFIGTDNIRESEYLFTPLSTISRPLKEMTKISIARLIDRIETQASSDPVDVVLSGELILRDTTLPLK